MTVTRSRSRRNRVSQGLTKRYDTVQPCLRLLHVCGILSILPTLILGAEWGYPCFAKARSSARTEPGGSGGFGAPSSMKNEPQKLMSPTAKKLLKKHRNNVDLASSDYYQAQTMHLSDGSRTISSDDLHAAKVKATWDTVALFLPVDYARTQSRAIRSTTNGLHLCCMSAYRIL